MTNRVTLPSAETPPDEAATPAVAAPLPVLDAVSRLGRKWTLQVLRCLASGPTRFSGLQRQLPGLSSYMLARTLRDLERDGLVTRIELSSNPPRIAYRLSTIGATLNDSVDVLTQWATRYGDRITQARAAFDRKPQP